MSGIERASRRAEVRESREMRWQLATWLDKHETPEGGHRISVVRDVDDDEAAGDVAGQARGARVSRDAVASGSGRLGRAEFLRVGLQQRVP